MGVFNYNDIDASLVPFSRSTFDLIRNESRVAVFDFKNDFVCILDQTAPAKGFIGTVQQAIDGSIISFTRATAAGRINASGLYESVSSGVWRRQYDPLTLEPLGYLPEPGRTNLLTNSNTIPASTGVTATTGASMGADGTLSLTRLLETATSGEHYSDQTITATNGTTYVFAYDVRAYAGSFARYVRIRFHTSGSGSYVFEPLTGQWVSGTAPPTGGIINLGGGLYRIWAAVTATSSGTLGCRIQLSDPAAGAVYMGDTNSGADVGARQVEVGAYPTSYIPTEASAVTRNADVMIVPLSKLPWDSTAYTMLVTAQKSPDTGVSAHRPFGVDDDSSNNRTYFATGAAGAAAIRAFSLSSAVNVADFTANGVITGRYKASVAAAADDFELVSGGVSRGQDSVAPLPVGLSKMRIGRDPAGNEYAAPIESIILIPRRLPQAEMIERTAT